MGDWSLVQALFCTVGWPNSRAPSGTITSWFIHISLGVSFDMFVE
jgi:hypothetical protein